MAAITVCDNFLNNVFVAPASGNYMDVTNPATDEVIGRVALSSAADVDSAVAHASSALEAWQQLTVKSRAQIMFKFHYLVNQHIDELADLIVLENSKTRAEAIAEVAKANETVEWACSMPQLAQGHHLQVSRGITCHDVREPLGIVACIVPFNFPMMVPCWTVPIALVAGNAVILKPSEKVPLTMRRVAELMYEAGVPAGVFQIVNGAVDSVTALCDHPRIKAVTFVGSSKVARLVAQRCRALDKKVLALGGAKNHLVALPDCDLETTASDVVTSFSGCAGQRCMAASVLLLVGEQPELLAAVCAQAAALTQGHGKGQVGPVIDDASKQRILGYINGAEQRGAKVLVDGRGWAARTPGSWVGPTVLLFTDATDPCMQEEIFGPVLSVFVCSSPEHAMAVEHASPFGNAACVYTQSGSAAEWFSTNFSASMIGVNVGIPVPREPFSFGGMYPSLSKYGDGDITGDGAMEFFTRRRKITTKWAVPKGGVGDMAQFK